MGGWVGGWVGGLFSYLVLVDIGGTGHGLTDCNEEIVRVLVEGGEGLQVDAEVGADPQGLGLVVLWVGWVGEGGDGGWVGGWVGLRYLAEGEVGEVQEGLGALVLFPVGCGQVAAVYRGAAVAP